MNQLYASVVILLIIYALTSQIILRSSFKKYTTVSININISLQKNVYAIVVTMFDAQGQILSITFVLLSVFYYNMQDVSNMT